MFYYIQCALRLRAYKNKHWQSYTSCKTYSKCPACSREQERVVAYCQCALLLP